MVSHTPGAKGRMKERLKGHMERDEEARARSAPRLTRSTQTRAKKVGVELPENRSDYLIEEDEVLVFWEREVRRYLSIHVAPSTATRLVAPEIYAWSQGGMPGGERRQGGVVNPELRRINKVLRHYFGPSFKSFIAGKQYPNVYRVHKGFYLQHKPPLTLTLYAEYLLKVLSP